MMLNERLQKIAKYLVENQTGTISQLSQLNNVSSDTVRRDLALLEKEGLLRRVRGGAVCREADVTAPVPEQRQAAQKKEKREIAALLGPYISDGQAIGLCGGSTCAEVAAFLVENYYRLMVLTNSLQALQVLDRTRTFTVLVPGGIVDTDADELFGQQCEANIRKYNLDVAILGAWAVSAEKGITDDRFYQVGVARAMLSSAQRKILVADSSKFDRTACINVCPLEELDLIISDSGLSLPTRRALTERGPRIITPEEKAFLK